jgi:hypothetical protein
MRCSRLSLTVGQTFPKVLYPRSSILDPRYRSKGGPRPPLRTYMRRRAAESVRLIYAPQGSTDGKLPPVCNWTHDSLRCDNLPSKFGSAFCKLSRRCGLAKLERMESGRLHAVVLLRRRTGNIYFTIARRIAARSQRRRQQQVRAAMAHAERAYSNFERPKRSLARQPQLAVLG